jgi:Lrp/AsnC family transcriptional regulator, leucine-responsive regulatory protein
MRELNKSERKVLSVLEENCRMPSSQIAKRVNLSSEGVIKIINRLIERNIISKFGAKLNYSRVGYTLYTVHIKLTKLNKIITQKIKKIILKHKVCVWHNFTEGEYDLLLSIRIVTKEDKQDMSNLLLLELSGYILEKEVGIVTKGFAIAKSFLDKPRINKLFTIMDETVEPLNLSEQEKRLIDLIKKNSRESVLILAEKLKTSPKTIISKIKKFKNEGIISGFNLELNMAELGYHPIIALISLGKYSEEEYNQLLKYFQSHGNISHFIRKIAKYDIELTFNVKNTKDFYELIEEIRNKFSFIKKISTLIRKWD